MERVFYVYILASRRNGTLYVGVTNDLGRRISEHRESLVAGFTATHGVKRLVWYDLFATVDEAIAHEKRIKHWRRQWKLALIDKQNPDWDDLYATLAWLPKRHPGRSDSGEPGPSGGGGTDGSRVALRLPGMTGRERGESDEGDVGYANGRVSSVCHWFGSGVDCGPTA